MCGGYTIRLNPNEYLRVKEPGRYGAWKPIYNARPGEILPIVTEEKPKQLTLALWDYRPHWANKANTKGVINARAETLVEKPYFKNVIQKQRCIIPADGFYEWKKSGSARQPYFFHRKDDKPFHFAGIYDVRPDDSKQLGFAIITTKPNSMVSTIHNRMPVMLTDDEIELWLTTKTPLPEIFTMFRPYQAKLMDYYPVSPLVNNARNKSAEVLNRTNLL